MNHQHFACCHNKEDSETKKKEGLILNIVVIVVSMILIGVVIIIVVVDLNGPEIEACTEKSLIEVCTKTEEPETCFHLLRPVGETATVLNYVKAAINATFTELLMVTKPKPRLERSLTPLQQQSYEDCLELLSFGKEELESLYVKADSSIELGNSDDMMNGLSAVLSYQHTCSDELARTNSYATLGHSLKVPILLTRIILAIVDNFSERPLSISIKAQGLDEFPKWFSTRERKIVESQEKGGHQHWKVDAVVAKDGSGQFSSISESFKACPQNNKGACLIYVRRGKYEERVVIPKDVKQVFMFGDGPTKTIVTGINKRHPKTVTTSYRAATFVVMGKGFTCKNMGFTAPTHIIGAPAVLVLSDHAAFFNCKIDGEEGSLFALAQRQFYRNCEIHGSVDIIKGDSATVTQNSQIIVKPRNSFALVSKRNIVTAQTRIDRYQTTGLVIQNCTIIAQEENISTLNATTYLGAPYSEYSRTIIMESFLGDLIHPKGWCKWSDNYGTETVTYREFNNTGPGARTDERINWNGYRTILEREQMINFTVGRFIQADKWLLNTSIPYESGFIVR